MSAKKFGVIFIGFFILVIYLVWSKVNVTATGGLVGWWKLDETVQGSSAVDSSGSGNNGTGVGTGSGPAPSTDVPPTTFTNPRSASFNGTDQYLNCGNSPTNLPIGSHARTITAWIKGNSFSGGSGKTVAGWGNDVAGQLSEMRVNSSGKIEFHGNSNDIPGTTTLSTGQWYYVSITVSSGGAVTLYLNGTQDGTGSVTLNTTATNCKIGKQPDFNGQFFNGLIDEVRIYDSALTPTQISNLAAGESDPDPIPSPTPSPTVTQTTTSNASSQTAPTCTASLPTSAPDLFQISTSPTTATLYFSPVSPITGYAFSYGPTESADQYTAQMDALISNGVISFQIKSLSKNSTYYFKVRGLNSCVPGPWSKTVRATTTTNGPIPKLATSKPLQVTITKDNASTPNPTPMTTTEGYNLKIKVVDKNVPVPGATVEIHSIPQKTVTDKDGYARFTNVEKGEHTITLAYNNYQGQEKVSVDGAEKEISINISIGLNPTSPWPIVIGVAIGGALVVVLIFIFVLFRRREEK